MSEKDWTEGLPSYADARTPEEIRAVAQAWDERAAQIRAAHMGQTQYLYVLEDTTPRRFAAMAPPETFTVYEMSDIRDGRAHQLQPVCGGLGRVTVQAFASYPEIRPLLIEQWERMQARNKWTAGWRSNKKLGKAIDEAQKRHPMQMPRCMPRSVLDQFERGER